MGKKHRRDRRNNAEIRLPLDSHELAVLRRVARYYERNWGVARFLVHWTSGPATRARFRFVAEEGRWLKKLADHLAEEAVQDEDSPREVTLTVRALVAYWGRLLSSLRSSRARRRLSANEIASREALIEKIESLLRSLSGAKARELSQEIETRRVAEQEWMRQRLAEQSE